LILKVIFCDLTIWLYKEFFSEIFACPVGPEDRTGATLR
jgi:hypothetical protein